MVLRNKDGKILSPRLWAFTSFNFDFDYKKLFDSDENIVYMVLGHETCPTTGRKHKQGMVYFKNGRSSKKNFCKEFKVALDGCSMCYSGIDSNYKYCTKEAGEIEEYGVRPKQGQRNDLIDLKVRIEAGESVDDVCLDDPVMVHQYGRTLDRIADITLRKKWRNWMTEGFWFYGATGKGKSHFWKKTYNPESHYVVETSDKGWWDGYSGQEVVIFDEFRGGTPYSELLSLVNDTPKRVPRRGREPVPFLARKVIITSALSPHECFKNLSFMDGWGQFYRRFHICEFINRNEICVKLFKESECDCTDLKRVLKEFEVKEEKVI